MAARPSTFVGRWTDVRHDALASFVVFLVALPLCIGITVASGAPTGSGIVTGIIAGLVVGWLAGCPLQVSGPAAGLTIIVWELIQEYGVERYSAVVLMAGVIQILAAWLRIGHWFRAVSPAVVHGMLAGIGALIFASQFHVMIDDVPKGSGIANVMTLPGAVIKGVFPDGNALTNHQEAAWIGVLTIGTILVWTLAVPKRFRVVPAVLVGVIVATATATWFELPIAHIAVQDNLLSIIHVPSLDMLEHLLDTTLLAEGLALAFIASVETLLSATAVDQLHHGPRTRYNKELFAQGTGNMLCGIAGALPMTGVIVRSSANVEAGARTRFSAVLHGAWLLFFVSFLPFIMRLIPTASLGAILVYTGFKLMDFGVLKDLRVHGRSEIIIFFVTMGTIISMNLLTGVLLGVGLAIAKLLYTTQDLDANLELDHANGRLTLNLSGIATFLSLPHLASTLEQVPPSTELQVRFASLRHIDHACLNLLASWEKLHEASGGKVGLDWGKLNRLLYHTRKDVRQATGLKKWLH